MDEILLSSRILAQCTRFLLMKCWDQGSLESCTEVCVEMWKCLLTLTAVAVFSKGQKKVTGIKCLKLKANRTPPPPNTDSSVMFTSQIVESSDKQQKKMIFKCTTPTFLCANTEES